MKNLPFVEQSVSRSKTEILRLRFAPAPSPFLRDGSCRDFIHLRSARTTEVVTCRSGIDQYFWRSWTVSAFDRRV